MNFLSFEYFQALRGADTIRQAAESLYISPQALSEHLNKLERELGVSLLRRTTPLTLTEEGELFARCAQDCLEARQRLERQLEERRGRQDGRVALGVPTGMPPPLLLPFVSWFRRVHPELLVSITELPTRTGALSELPGHIDLVLGAFPEGDKLRHQVILDSRSFVVAAHRDLLRQTLGAAEADRLEQSARRGEAVDIARFRACPFVRKRPGSIVRDNEDRIFRAAGFQAKGQTETGDLELSLRLTLLGEAVLYLPAPMARANFLYPALPGQESPVLLCPVDVQGEYWALTAAHAVRRPLSPGMETLIGAAREYYTGMLGG